MIVLALPALGLLATGCMPYKNGAIPADALTTISPSCQVVNEIAANLTRLLDDAKAAGLVLRPETTSTLDPGEPQPPRIEACYRTFEVQQWWRSYYCSKGACGFAAVPGTSRHGWGRAVDFEDQNGELTFQSPAYHWLVANAASYGFYQPEWAKPGGGAPEAWHWEA
jgi:hypothetical protein